MQVYLFILMTIVVIFSGIKFRNEMKTTENEDGTRNVFIRFLIIVILYVMFIIVLLL